MNIIYLRVSTNEDRQDLQQQLRAILEHFKLKEYKVLMDEGSAYNQSKITKRKEFINLLNICFDASNITINDIYLQNYTKKNINLYVWDYSRIMRNIDMNVLFFILCMRYGISIHSYKDNIMIDTKGIDSESPTIRLMALMNYTMLSYSAEQYSKDTSVNIKRSYDTENKGYSTYGIKWGKGYKANNNWEIYWSKTIVNNKGVVIDRISKDGYLTFTIEEDIKFKKYVKNKLSYLMRSEVIEIVKKEKGIIITPSWLSRNF